MAEASFLVADRLTRAYGATVALDRVDLAAAKGSVLAVLGPNGCGKTTTVRIFATLLRPDSGRALVGGHDVVTSAAAVRAMIGLAGQYAAVDPFLTGRENLELVAGLRHLLRGELRRQVDVLLERLELERAAGRLVRTYSGGMRRRLDLAAALIGHPPVLFLDEPTTGLDPRSRRELWDLIGEQARSGTTVLLTTQYMEEADRLAGQVAVLDRGQVIASGTPAELKAKVGGDHLELTVPDPGQRQAARDLLGACAEPASAGEPEIIRIPLPVGGGVPITLLAELAHRGVWVSDLQVHRPTLEDVFLHLTGQPVPTGPPATGGAAAMSTNAPLHTPVPPAVRDTVAISCRNLRRLGRAPNLLLLSLTTGVLFVLLFRYVFGGAIRTPGSSYVDYLMPGAFILTVTASAVTTGVGFAEDLASGAIDRFRSLPIARSAVLAGRMLSDAVRLLLLIAAMTAVGFAVGFRVHTGALAALAGLVLTITFGMAFSWVMLYLALALRTAEATQAAGQTLMFLLTFLSSAFVPLATMPGWLQAIARLNPVTYAVDALRALLVGGPTARPVLLAVAWTAGLVIVFVPLAVRRYRRG
jgi:ABC transporter DrrB family efflux protein